MIQNIYHSYHQAMFLMAKGYNFFEEGPGEGQGVCMVTQARNDCSFLVRGDGENATSTNGQCGARLAT